MSEVTCSIGEDIVLAVFLAHKFDKHSLFSKFPKDVVCQILKWYVPSDSQPYLLPRALSRSYYRICKKKPITTSARPRFRMPTSSLYKGISCDLQETSTNVLNFIVEANSSINFKTYSTKQMEKLFDEYLLFLLLLAARGTTLAPSLEIQLIWFSHMLQSEDYKSFSMQPHYSCLLSQHHPAVGSFTGGSRNKAIQEYQCVFAEYYPGLDYDRLEETLKNYAEFMHLREILWRHYTPAMATDDQLWLAEFQKFTKGTDVNSPEFKLQSVIGYQRMLHMKAKYSDEMEMLGFAPCPSIDLIWHTHLLHPSFYDNDLEKYFFTVPAHKLLEEKDRTLVFFNDRDDHQEKLWRKEFHESLFDYATLKSNIVYL